MPMANLPQDKYLIRIRILLSGIVLIFVLLLIEELLK